MSDISIENLAKEVTALNKKVEQLRYHNFTLATLVANLIEGESVVGSLQELTVLLDLSKEDLKISQKLISSYDGDIDLLKKNFNNPDGNLSEQNLPLIVQAYRNSSSMIEKCDKIISDLQK
ncbi:hypothetical protein [Psychrobacter sp.]|uniref:hypothetical protein n=1 Tax=Psychrobacter sp. TaxID=56811 RepID=UPI0025CF5E74|nr:hypothetical protein [Psychrobacter sp.]